MIHAGLQKGAAANWVQLMNETAWRNAGKIQRKFHLIAERRNAERNMSELSVFHNRSAPLGVLFSIKQLLCVQTGHRSNSNLRKSGALARFKDFERN